MSELVKCPRCEEGDLLLRQIHYSYANITRESDGSIGYEPSVVEDEFDADCWMCLDCGAILDWDEEKAIQEGDDD